VHLNRFDKTSLISPIDQPELFFKALANRDQERQTRNLIKGPEGRFIDDLNAVVTSLKRLTSHVPEFLSDDNKNRINTQITSVQQLINQLHERINNDKHTTQTDNRNTLPAPDRDTGHQPSTNIGHLYRPSIVTRFLAHEKDAICVHSRYEWERYPNAGYLNCPLEGIWGHLNADPGLNNL